MVKLSILIPTVPSRAERLDNLLADITKQVTDKGNSVEHTEGCILFKSYLYNDIEILTALDQKQNSVGFKRQRLLQLAKGEYICYVDDDDKIADNYVYLILKALEDKPDCVGFKGFMTSNRINEESFIISTRFGWPWYSEAGTHYRCPNHLSPVKKDIAIKVGFRDMRNGEDGIYSQGILPYLQNESFIDEELYYYDFNSSTSETQ